LRRWFESSFERFREGPFRRTVRLAVTWRYTTFALAIAALIFCIGLVQGGRIGFVFFPSPEADKVYGNVQMVAGTPRRQTIAMLDEMERALYATAERFAGLDADLVRMDIVKVGTAVGRHDLAMPTGDHMGGVVVELKPSDERTVRTDAFITAWREEIRPLAGLDTLTILAARGGPPGREVDVRLSGGSDIADLKAAAREVKALLARYPGVSDVEDDLPYGKRESIIEVTPAGRALGFTTESVGRQVRNAFEGAIAKRFPRKDEEVTVRVQFPREVLNEGALDDLYLRSPKGAEVAFPEIVERRSKRGFSIIKREDGKREVAVTAEIDKTITTNNKVLEALARDGLFDIAARHGLSVEFAGKAEEQATTLGDMRIGAMIGLAAIFIILAWVFASYTRPLVVMSVIPLGFVGAALGHWLLGFDLTILSIVALVGLSGIVVNDSIILVSTIDERLRRGEGTDQAIVDGACDRLRAVFLTSATTIGGLTPLMFERSLQAQFLIPMALTIIFGLMVTTLLVLFVVPALIAVQGDIARMLGRGRAPAPAVEEAPPV
jgi:multidrug efflux pump subunit AcrB